jgi:CheY-like chemotaxis protein
MASDTSNILLIEGNSTDALLLCEMFSEQAQAGVEATHVDSMSGAEALFAERAFDVILLGLGLPYFAVLKAVRQTYIGAARTPLGVLTGLDEEPLGDQAVQQNAEDFLIKGQIEPGRLLLLETRIPGAPCLPAAVPDKSVHMPAWAAS